MGRKIATSFCDDNEFQKNEHGAYIYVSDDGNHRLDMPSILDEFSDFIESEEKELRGQVADLEDEIGEANEKIEELEGDLENLEAEYEFKEMVDQAKHDLFMENYGKFSLEQFEEFLTKLK